MVKAFEMDRVRRLTETSSMDSEERPKLKTRLSLQNPTHASTDQRYLDLSYRPKENARTA